MDGAKRIRVLLVEDDGEDVGIFQRHMGRLRAYSATVLRAADVDEARALIADNRLDVVFVDLNLGGGGDGLELLHACAGAAAAPPVVVVTGSGDEGKAVEAMKAGASDYIVKGKLSADLLERTIRSVREKHVLKLERERMMRKLAELSVMDELTCVANRRHLMAKLQEELQRSERSGHLFAVLMIDVDNFKDVNDRYGHQIGDDVLRSCAGAFLQALRSTDFVARYGGDEFCVLLLDASPEGARRVAEKLREVVTRLADPVPTVSIGVSLWRPRASRDSLLSMADKALYRAKQAGRNRVMISGDEFRL